MLRAGPRTATSSSSSPPPSPCSSAAALRRSSAAQPQPQPRPLAAKKQDEPETDPDDVRPRVTVFFGTQTGTAEGFAKVPSYCCAAFSPHLPPSLTAKAQCSAPVPALHSEFLKSVPLCVDFVGGRGRGQGEVQQGGLQDG
jgi:hypothetical protein